MKADAYKVGRGLKSALIFFDEFFFEHIAEEFAGLSYEQEKIRKEEIHERIISHFAANTIENSSLLVSRIIKLANGNHEVLIFNPPEIYKIILNLNIKNNESVLPYSIERIDRPLPPKLNPENQKQLFEILETYLCQYKKRKQNQRIEFEQGKRFIQFIPEPEPSLNKPMTKADLRVETLVTCSPALIELIKTKFEIEHDYQIFLKLKEDFETLLTHNKNDTQLTNYCLETFNRTGWLPASQALEENFILKLHYLKETIKHIEDNSTIQDQALTYFTSLHYLNFYKQYIAWTLHFIACRYHLLVQENKQNTSRPQEIKKLIALFKPIIQFNEAEEIPSYLKFKHALEHLSCEEIKLKINQFLKNDKQNGAAKAFKQSADIIQSISCAQNKNIHFLPFKITEPSLLGSFFFEWSTDAINLQKSHDTARHYLDKSLSQCLSEMPEYNLKDSDALRELANRYNNIKAQITGKKEILTYRREMKRERQANKSHQVKTRIYTLLKNIQTLSAESQNPVKTETLDQYKKQVQDIADKIDHYPDEAIIVSLDLKSQDPKDELDLLIRDLIKIKARCAKLHASLSNELQEQTLNAAQEFVNAKNQTLTILQTKFKVDPTLILNYKTLLQEEIDIFNDADILYADIQAHESKIKHVFSLIKNIKPRPDQPYSSFKENLASLQQQITDSLLHIENKQIQLIKIHIFLIKKYAVQLADECTKNTSPIIQNSLKLSTDIAHVLNQMKIESPQIASLITSFHELVKDFLDYNQQIHAKSIDDIEPETLTSFFANKHVEMNKLATLIREADTQLQHYKFELALKHAQLVGGQIKEQAQITMNHLKIIKNVFEQNSHLICSETIKNLAEKTSKIVNQTFEMAAQNFQNLSNETDKINHISTKNCTMTHSQLILDKAFSSIERSYQYLLEFEGKLLQESYPNLLTQLKLSQDFYLAESNKFHYLQHLADFSKFQRQLNESIFKLNQLLKIVEKNSSPSTLLRQFEEITAALTQASESYQQAQTFYQNWLEKERSAMGPIGHTINTSSICDNKAHNDQVITQTVSANEKPESQAATVKPRVPLKHALSQFFKKPPHPMNSMESKHRWQTYPGALKF